MLLKKFFNAGFEDIRVAERFPFGLPDLRRYPLFTPDFIEFLEQVIPPPRHHQVAFSVVVTARRGDALPAEGAEQTP